MATQARKATSSGKTAKVIRGNKRQSAVSQAQQASARPGSRVRSDGKGSSPRTASRVSGKSVTGTRFVGRKDSRA